MLSVAEAQARVLAAVSALPAETLPTAECLGRVLADPVIATLSQPPCDVSAMDGYAYRFQDATEPLEIAGESAAGHGFDGSFRPGACVRIFTGAPVPLGADTVVMQEDVEIAADGRVRVRDAGLMGRHIRPAGNDFRAGASLLAPGTRLAARHLALVAAANVPTLRVRRRPRVAILATGDELVPLGGIIGPSQIVSSNSVALAALLSDADVLDLGIVPDRKDALIAALDVVEADLILTIGGASVGDHDLVKAALGETGLTLNFWKIAQRPGKPMLFGEYKGTPLIGLPGNPVSAYVCAHLYVLPVVARLQGAADLLPKPVRLPVATDLPANASIRQAYLRVRFVEAGGETRAEPSGNQDSAVLSALAAADGLLIRPPQAAPLKAGEFCDVLLLS